MKLSCTEKQLIFERYTNCIDLNELLVELNKISLVKRNIRTIYTFASKHNLKRTLGHNKTTGIVNNGTRIWQDDELLFLRDNFHDISNEELSKILGRSKKSLMVKASRLNLRKSKVFRCKSQYENSTLKVHKIGDIFIKKRRLKNKEGWEYRKFIKLHNGHKMLYHHYVWNEHYGFVPTGLKTRFIDGDPMNCDICNIESCSGIFEKYGKEITELTLLNNAIKNKVKWNLIG